MLFNSYAFVLVFLPIALIGYQVAGMYSRRTVIAWLGFISLVFYGYWRPALVLLLVSSIAVNYCAATLLSRERQGSRRSHVWLWGAIGINLAVLFYFKYSIASLNFLSHAAGTGWHWSNMILPLGISFFTFTQIAYLVDLQQGIATLQDIPSYVLFVTFFPHLIAGPILHHKEMMPQFNQNRRYQLNFEDLAVGFSWFIMGLGKKVLLADHFALTANAAYAYHGPLPLLLAWRGVLGYALQLYFDFSGYSDMALGLARMFSINFPLNFSSPYKAKNIADFWQRWHITLTQYITAYVFSPMQFFINRRRMAQGKKVSRKALATPGGFASMVAFPMMATMFLAGIWHGAGFQFIIFGLLHGFYLTVNHAWNTLRTRTASAIEASVLSRRVTQASSVLLTFFCVLIAQVFFRAASTSQAVSVLAGMFGAHGLHLHQFLRYETKASVAVDLASLVPGFFIVWALPNTQQILSRFRPSLALTPWDKETLPQRLLWTPKLGWALAMACVFFYALVFVRDPSTFLYFQF